MASYHSPGITRRAGLSLAAVNISATQWLHRHLGHNSQTVTWQGCWQGWLIFLECFKLKLSPDLTNCTFSPFWTKKHHNGLCPDVELCGCCIPFFYREQQSKTLHCQPALLWTHAGLSNGPGCQAPMEAHQSGLQAAFTVGLSTAQWSGGLKQ